MRNEHIKKKIETVFTNYLTQAMDHETVEIHRGTELNDVLLHSITVSCLNSDDFGDIPPEEGVRDCTLNIVYHASPYDTERSVLDLITGCIEYQMQQIEDIKEYVNLQDADADNRLVQGIHVYDVVENNQDEALENDQWAFLFSYSIICGEHDAYTDISEVVEVFIPLGSDIMTITPPEGLSSDNYRGFNVVDVGGDSMESVEFVDSVKIVNGEVVFNLTSSPIESDTHKLEVLFSTVGTAVTVLIPAHADQVQVTSPIEGVYSGYVVEEVSPSDEVIKFTEQQEVIGSNYVFDLISSPISDTTHMLKVFFE